MEININFLIFLTTIIVGINTGILCFQYKSIENLDKRFFYYWTMGSFFNFMGLIINYGRSFPMLKNFTTVANNIFFFIGAIFAYLGTKSFLKKYNYKNHHFLYLIVPSLISVYFTYVKDSSIIRGANFSFFISLMAFLSVILIFRESKKCKECASKLLFGTLLIYSLYFGIRVILYVVVPNSSESLRLITYTVFLLCSILFSFSYNVLLNRKFIKRIIEDQRNLKAIFNTNPDILIITKLSDGKIVRVNDGFSKHLGFTEEEAIGKMTTDLNVWIDLNERNIFINTIRELGNIENFEVTLRKKSSEEITCLLSANLILLDDEEYVVTVVRNISNRKILEDKLEESERFLSEIINNNGAFIYAKSLDGKYKLINKKWEEFTNINYSDVIGKTDFDIFPNEIAEKLKEMDTEVINSGTLIEREEVLETESQIKYFISIKFPLRDKNNQINGICGISTEITERKKAEEKIKELAKQLEIERDYAQKNSITDALTNLYNRRFFDDSLKKEFFRMKRTNLPLSLIILDIDYFKKYNDTYGHQGGDECLKKIAETIKTIIQRTTDFVTRYGGEEFAIILPETNSNSALKMAEKVRKAVENLKIPHMSSTVKNSVTISLGVATVYKDTVTAPEQIITLADIALYNAKESGRNKTNVAVINLLNSNTSSHINLIWDKNDESGNILIDEEHKTLLNISNRLINAMTNKYSKDECIIIIKELIDSLTLHFNDEEELFMKTSYPLGKYHKNLHEELIKKSRVILKKYEDEDLTLKELIDFLVYDVIEHHLVVEDKTFFPFVSSKS